MTQLSNTRTTDGQLVLDVQRRKTCRAEHFELLYMTDTPNCQLHLGNVRISVANPSTDEIMLFLGEVRESNLVSLTHAFNKFGIKVVLKYSNTVKSRMVKNSPTYIERCIYSIPCRNCKFSYIGQIVYKESAVLDPGRIADTCDNMKALFFLPLAACVSAQVVMPFGAYAPYAAAPYAAAQFAAAPYAAAPYAAAQFAATPYSAAPWTQKSQYHSQDELGQFSFGHSSFDQSRSEVRLWNGQVLGHYSYIDANGEPAITYYEAGPNGFRVLGANNLPEGHAADKSVPEYTPEVAAARAEFAIKFEEAKAAAAAASAEPELKTAEEPAAEAAAEPVAEEAAEPALEAEAEAAPEAAVEPATEEAAPSRRRRDVALPLPYLHPVPTTTKVSYTTSHFEPKESATPADTMFLNKVTKEHELAIPSVRYVQPTVKVQPITYTNTAFPSFFPFAASPFMTSPFVTLKAE
ncbi:uncharacterized protein LOC143032260 [Oratosquilla oratoria]|uniref:uncharacterized protein LOC143032260 n=1 Tax=Oratosquilla oratoria TaxID=337810 RepID=UPI003F75FBB7